MTKWTYARHGGLEYPVQPGDAWSVGPHRFVCGDIEAGDRPLDVTSQYGRYGRVILTDPPWNAGNAGGFRTKAGVPRKVDFSKFLHVWADLMLSLRAKHLWVIMGGQSQAYMEKLLADRGCTMYGRWAWQFTSSIDPFTSVWSLPGQPPPPIQGFSLQRNMGFVEASEPICKLYPKGHVIVDPCVGLGYAPRAAHIAGHTFTGMELSPNRLSATLSVMGKQTGIKPQRLEARRQRVAI